MKYCFTVRIMRRPQQYNFPSNRISLKCSYEKLMITEGELNISQFSMIAVQCKLISSLKTNNLEYSSQSNGRAK